jgi:hypothetical protein
MGPFPHLVIKPALPREVFDRLAREFPEDIAIGKGGHESERTCRYFARDALGEGKLSPLWQDFLRHHTSAAFFDEAVSLLLPALEAWYPERLDFISRAGTVPRGLGRGDIELETQFAVNLPCDETLRTPIWTTRASSTPSCFTSAVTTTAPAAVIWRSSKRRSRRSACTAAVRSARRTSS